MSRKAIVTANWTGTNKADNKSGTAGNDGEMDGRGGNDTIRGLGGDDNIKGGKGADVLFGGSGDDRLYISGGDNVTGGTGADTFVLWDYGLQPSVSDAGAARVRDFQTDGAKHDKVDLTIFTGLDWSERDAGLDDGLEIVRKGADTLIRVRGAEGVVSSMLLVGVSKADLTEDHFDWPFV